MNHYEIIEQISKESGIEENDLSDLFDDFFRILYKNMMFTYRFDRNLTKFSQKNIVFKRERKHNDINYPVITFEDCYYEFVKNMQNVISSDNKIINLFF